MAVVALFPLLPLLMSFRTALLAADLRVGLVRLACFHPYRRWRIAAGFAE